MMPLNLLRLQLMESYAVRSRLAVRFGVTVLLALPFIFVAMPARAKSSGLVMVILFTSFFGTAIAHARLCEDGRFARLRLLPIPAPLLWLDLILGAFISRILPAAALLGGFLLVNSAAVTPGAWVYIAAELGAAMMLLVTLATITGHVCRNNGQVHLFGALVCAILAFVSGIVPPAAKLTPLLAVMAANPLFRLQYRLTELSAGTFSIPATIPVMCSAFLGLFILAIVLRWTAGSVPNKELT